MSIRVMTAVFDRYPNGSGEMLLALSLADHAHDDGTHIYPSVDSLAKKTRQSVRSTQYQLKAMLDAGWLVLTSEGHGGRGSHREYSISSSWLKGADFASLQKGADSGEKGADSGKEGCNPLHPPYKQEEPSVNRQVRASRLPATWVLPKAYGDWALAEFPAWTDEHVRRIAMMFKNHWIAAAGQQSRKLDWHATWQNWCLKEPAVPAGAKTAFGAAPAAWYEADAGIIAKGREIGLTQSPGERMGDYRWRIEDHLRDAVLGHAPDAPAAPPVAAPAPVSHVSQEARDAGRVAMRDALKSKVLPPQVSA